MRGSYSEEPEKASECSAVVVRVLRTQFTLPTTLSRAWLLARPLGPLDRADRAYEGSLRLLDSLLRSISRSSIFDRVSLRVGQSLSHDEGRLHIVNTRSVSVGIMTS